MIEIIHHGGALGVTGSCHQLVINSKESLMIDCGLFQGKDNIQRGGTSTVEGEQLKFDLKTIPHISSLIITHSHIDHIGRLPYLIAAGYRGKILCSQPSAKLLPVTIEDALKVGFTRNQRLIRKFLSLVNNLLVPLTYNKWYPINDLCKVKLHPAGHILGSAYVEVDVRRKNSSNRRRVIFSGDLGPPYTPLLKTPKSPYRADWLVLESTYGDKEHEKRSERRKLLERLLKKAITDRGTVLIPAFSLGRTQELLYDLNQILFRLECKGLSEPLRDIEVIVDSPLSNSFTNIYKEMEPFWDKEAKRRLKYGDHPLIFGQLRVISGHNAHIASVNNRLKSSKPAIIIAASGMCNGGRIMNYLKALIGHPHTDILFVGYQADGTPGRIIQKYGPQNGYVTIDGEKYTL